ncbi:hypothetical protein ACWFRJ_43400 [Streptomyces sp. NPDC055239]
MAAAQPAGPAPTTTTRIASSSCSPSYLEEWWIYGCRATAAVIADGSGGMGALPQSADDQAALRSSAQHALQAAAASLAGRQEADGSWRGEFSGMTCQAPMYVLAHSITRTPLDGDQVRGLAEGMRHRRNPDGSVGLYEQGPGTLFCTVLTYTALRLLGESPDDPGMTAMRRWIHRQGGPLRAAPCTKFWLCLTGLYDYGGLDPLLPELWLLPRGLPLHPSKLLCHARQQLLPMTWLYAHRATVPADDVIKALRVELYERDYAYIPWHKHRATIASCDNLAPASMLIRLGGTVARLVEPRVPRFLRRRAVDRVLAHLEYDGQHTNGLYMNMCVAALAAVVHHFRDPSAADAEEILDRMRVYLWHGRHGIGVQGCDSTQVWDTAFAAQALAAAGRTRPHAVDLALVKAQAYLCSNQLTDDLPQARTFHRDRRAGSWPFSTRAHGWAVSDCTGEALEALHTSTSATAAQHLAVSADATADLLLTWQNRDGGWSSYEPVRGPRWLARLNPMRVFDDCVTERSYTECTASVLKALNTLKDGLPPMLRPRIDKATAAGRTFLLDAQRPDGSFEGSWGICFTYGTWFGIEGLRATGLDMDHPSLVGAAQFLRDTQLPDGSWSETPDTSLTRRYTPAPEGEPVQTAWALLGLCGAGQATSVAARAAVRFLVQAQLPDGSYPQGGYTGITFRTLALRYDNYRHYFPLWALAVWTAAYAERA